MQAEPNWTLLPAGLPSACAVCCGRCLRRTRSSGFATSASVRLALDGAFERPRLERAARRGCATRRCGACPAVGVAGMSACARRLLLVLWAPGVGARAGAAQADGAHRRGRVAADDRGASAILSPDGTMLAFVAQQAGQARLFIRKLDQLQAAALAGTEGADHPFFSPDGQWIAFFAGGRLKKVSVTGGAAVTLCDAPPGRGGTWTDDDTILFTPRAHPTRR